MSFQFAAASLRGTGGGSLYTLEVPANNNCGQTYQSLAAKWGTTLFTPATASVPCSFIPPSGNWRPDSVDLKNYIGPENLLFVFRNTAANQNNVYRDDVRLRRASVAADPKEQKFWLRPTLMAGKTVVRFYGFTGLQKPQLFTATGQKAEEKVAEVNGATGSYAPDLDKYAAGLYIVTAVFADRVPTKKVMKY